jgi:hypothetical protein
LEKYIEARRGSDDELTLKSFKAELSTIGEGDPESFDDAHIWTEGERVIVYDGVKEFSLSFRSLERYWKAPPTRAK